MPIDNKLIIVAAAVALIIIVALLLLTQPSEEPAPVGCRDENYGCYVGTLPCCEGLSPIDPLMLIDGECAFPNCGPACAQCGNGECDGVAENCCNCPEDCGTCEPPDPEVYTCDSHDDCAPSGCCGWDECRNIGHVENCSLVRCPYEDVRGCTPLECGGGEICMCVDGMCKNQNYSVLCGNGDCDAFEDCRSCPEDCGECPDVPCTGEGEIGITYESRCCPVEGLDRRPLMDEETCEILSEIEFTCVLCGNGICGPGENKCHCIKDCTPPEFEVEKDKCEDSGGKWDGSLEFTFCDCAVDYPTELKILDDGECRSCTSDTDCTENTWFTGQKTIGQRLTDVSCEAGICTGTPGVSTT